MPEQNEKPLDPEVRPDAAEETPVAETASPRPGWRAILHQLFEKARREQPVANHRELGRDRSRSLFLLVGAIIAVLLLFLGVFSTPNGNKKPSDQRRTGAPDLGRRVTPGEQNSAQTGSVAPLLSAENTKPDLQSPENVTPEEVSRTARPSPAAAAAAPNAAPKPTRTNPGPYALGRIDFSDPASAKAPPITASAARATQEGEDLRKPSLVFVRSAQNASAGSEAKLVPAALEQNLFATELPAGTRLVARLQSLVSTAIKTPVVATIEYNYERDGRIVIPAGARALGTLQQADRSGYVGLHFESIQMPDGTSQKLEATAMSLSYGPLKGAVSGKRTGTNFLVRAATGLGQAATFLVGNGVNQPLSESALLRDRIATNIGIAGDQQLNSLAFNQHIVVTVPGNTRFYIVTQKASASSETPGPPSTAQPSIAVPSAEELRQLMQLRRELSELYQQAGSQNGTQQASQQ
jgi:hypothetical protein